VTANQIEHDDAAPNQKPPIDLALRLDYLGHIQSTQQIIAGLSEALSVAIALVADRDRELKRAHNTIAHQRLELRALFTGRTLGEQRQADQREADQREDVAA